MAIRQMKYLIVAIEYFTKWIKAKPVAQITAHKVQHFVWKNIVCRFGEAVYKSRNQVGVRIG